MMCSRHARSGHSLSVQECHARLVEGGAHEGYYASGLYSHWALLAQVVALVVLEGNL